jgi:hypothetical protein
MTTEDIDMLSYALSRHVQAMMHGFTLQTDYGNLQIRAEDAREFAELLARQLRQKINHQQHGAGRAK